jgi:acyl-CoA thioesterase YciA
MQLVSTHIAMTKDMGVHGNLFGGKMLAALDEAVASFATMYCRTPNMVTLKIDEMVFKEAVKVNNQVRIYCEVVDVGNSSIQIKAEARKVSYYTEQERVVCSTVFTFVRIDEDGRPVPIADHVRKKFSTSQPIPESNL